MIRPKTEPWRHFTTQSSWIQIERTLKEYTPTLTYTQQQQHNVLNAAKLWILEAPEVLACQPSGPGSCRLSSATHTDEGEIPSALHALPLTRRVSMTYISLVMIQYVTAGLCLCLTEVGSSVCLYEYDGCVFFCFVFLNTCTRNGVRFAMSFKSVTGGLMWNRKMLTS